MPGGSASFCGPMTTSDILTNETIDLLSSHVSVRSFSDEPVADEMLLAALNAARRAPTSSNWQTYSIIVVRDQAKKERLAELAGGQRHIVQSQAFLAFVADFHRVDVVSREVHGIEPERGLEFTLTPVVDAALVGEAAQVALESFGLGAVMIGGIRAHVTDVAEVLGLPPDAFVVFGMSVGWPAAETSPDDLKPRLPEHLVIHHDEYNSDAIVEEVRAHNAELKAFYEARGRNLDQDAWSGPVARGAERLRYATQRAELEELGFRFN
jgi:nitroreductase